MKSALLLVALAIAFAASSQVAACNAALTADCPSAPIDNGGACSEDALECPYTVAPNAACGDTSSLASSCTCTSGAWVCPAFDCDAGATEGDGGPPDDSGPGDAIGDAGDGA